MDDGPLPSSLDPGTDPTYQERLTPAPWVWLAVAMVSLAFGLIVVPVQAGLAPVVALTVGTALVIIMWRWSPRVIADQSGLRAGRAVLPWPATSAVTVLDPAAMRHALGPGLNARAYLCIRGWVAGGVQVEVRDDADPTPYWLISSRAPEQLAAAIRRRTPCR